MAMTPKIVELYSKTRALHQEFVTADAEVRRLLNTNCEKIDQADAAYALRQTAEFADEIRKKCEELQKLAEKLTCVLAVAEHDPGPVRTAHCTASLDIKTIVTIPRQSTHPKEFAALMEFLGVKRHLWDVPQPEPNDDGEDVTKRHAVVKPHWPGLVDHLNELQAQGLPLPPGIDPNKTYPEYRLTIRKKKGVT